MIRRPKPGQRVRLHYREAIRAVCPHHGRTGVVVRAGRGPGPINVEVDLGDGVHVGVPRGNLVPDPEAAR